MKKENPGFGETDWVQFQVIDGAPLVKRALDQVRDKVQTMKGVPNEQQIGAVTNMIRKDTRAFQYVSAYDILYAALYQKPENVLTPTEQQKYLQEIACALENEFLL
ncbi:MAG: hypothetical protein ABI758_00710 [Candidatus Woesebacteria bacterium]